jgi:hypothetical protein
VSRGLSVGPIRRQGPGGWPDWPAEAQRALGTELRWGRQGLGLVVPQAKLRWALAPRWGFPVLRGHRLGPEGAERTREPAAAGRGDRPAAKG